MDPAEPPSGRQEEVSPGPESECKFQYKVPPWFLENVKTAEALRDVEANIRISSAEQFGVDKLSLATGSSNEKPSTDSTTEGFDHCFHVSQDSFDELLDTVASLQMPGSTGRLSPSRSSITLSCRMRFGLRFLDELVVLVAQELKSSLVPLNSQDLEDIGLDFHHQERSSQNNQERSQRHGDDSSDDGDSSDDNDSDTSHLAQNASHCYFGNCRIHHATPTDDKRGEEAFSALMNAVRSRAGQHEAGCVSHGTIQDSHQPLAGKASPTIFFLRDGLKKSMEDPYTHSSPLRRLRTMVRRHRKAGHNLIMVFAATNTDADETSIEPDLKIPWKVSRCKCWSCSLGDPSDSVSPGIKKITILPLSVPTSFLHDTKANWEGSVTATRNQSFKRRLNAQLSQYPASPSNLFEPHCDWFSLFPESVTSLFASVGFNTEVAAAFNLILARCSRRGTADVDDVRSILLRKANSIMPSPKANDPHTDWMAERRKVEENCDQYEMNHFSCLVGPGK